MEKQVKKIALYSLLTLIAVAIIGVSLFLKVEGNRLVVGGLPNAPKSVVGTRVGTSTTAVGFYTANTATTTYRTFIGRDVDLAVYDIFFTGASSSAANAKFNVLASPDENCWTSTTSPDVGNPYLVQDIRWTDAGDYFLNKVHSTSLAAGTSTISITNPVAGTGRSIILDNLAANCLALQINASSTEIQAQLTTKQH